VGQGQGAARTCRRDSLTRLVAVEVVVDAAVVVVDAVEEEVGDVEAGCVRQEGLCCPGHSRRGHSCARRGRGPGGLRERPGQGLEPEQWGLDSRS